MYKEYIERKIVRETKKAYLVEQEVNNRRDGWRTNFKWVAKAFVKNPMVKRCLCQNGLLAMEFGKIP